MIIIKKGQSCGNRPLIEGSVGKRENGEKKHTMDVEGILCALFCGENKEEILTKNPDITEQDFEDALTFSMYAVSQFNGKSDLVWGQDSPENYWAH